MQLQVLRKFTIIAILLMAVLSVQAQTVKELEKQRKQTLQQLESTNKMLNETKKSQKSTLTKLNILSKNINERKTLIKNISVEIGELDSEMNRLSQETVLLNNRLTVLKKDYAKLVQEAHINRSIYAKIMFVLSAKTFDQSYRRFRYLQEYSDYRKQQVKQIERIKTDIAHKSDSIGQHKSTKVEVVKQKEVEAQKLTKDEQKEKVVLTDLKKKEGKLRSDLKVQQKKAADLNNKIERIIAEEIRKAEAKRQAEIKRREAEERKRLAEEKKSSTSTNTASKETKTTTSKSSADTKSSTTSSPKTTTSSVSVSALTKEETLISGNFAANQGRLPWPTSNGFISGHYGVQAHPVLKHVTTNNKGVYIQTPSGSNARAVFEGTVTQVGYFPGSNNLVIIQHGDYRTVYANLTSVYVKSGEKVSAKQSIGKIYTDDDNDNKTELYFQIWKGRSLLNPESWIAR